MTRTWHGSCYACTCTTSDHQYQFARGFPPVSPRRDRSGGGVSSRFRQTTLNHDQIQTHGSGGDALRRNGACCARVPVPARSDLTGQGLPQTSGGFGPRVFFSFGAQPRRQAIAEQPPVIHFKNLRTNDPQAICGAVEGARNTLGEIQNV